MIPAASSISLLGLLNIEPDLDWLDTPSKILILAVLGTLAALFLIGRLLKRQPESIIDPAIVKTFNRRVTAWLMITAILSLALFLRRPVTIVVFGLVSFWGLREFITMTPTRRGDHRTLFWTFFFFTPLQYVLVWLGRDVNGFDVYNIYSVMIPVYASLMIPARIAFSGDHKRFLERTAKIQFGLLICVYALSYAPAILDMKLGQYNANTQTVEPWKGSNAGLLVFFIVVVQLSDALQYLWDKLLGKHVIAPNVNATKTWEGLVGGALSTSIAGALIAATVNVTPFLAIGAGTMSLIIAVMGACGTMTMSAIKRDRGVKDYGTLVQGHAGVLDRMDSVCFAAPVFFHVTRFFLEIE
jgi:phosphatidate cytidylyltransferase